MTTFGIDGGKGGKEPMRGVGLGGPFPDLVKCDIVEGVDGVK